MASSIETIAQTEEIPSQEKSSKETMVDSINSVLESCKWEHGYEPDRVKQAKVINNLPDNLIEELDAHLRTTAMKQAQMHKPEEDANLVLGGRVFEILVENDPSFAKPESITATLTGVLQDPERFTLLNELGQRRNPDLAYMHIDNQGTVIFDKAGEIKMAPNGLNARAVAQLKEDGIETSIRNLVRYLNNEPHEKKLKRCGLNEVVELRHQRPNVAPLFAVAENFSMILIVPANKDVDDTESLLPVINHNKSNEAIQEQIDLREEIKELLETRVEPINANFSFNETVALSHYFMEQIQLRRKRELSE